MDHMWTKFRKRETKNGKKRDNDKMQSGSGQSLDRMWTKPGQKTKYGQKLAV